MIGQRYPEKKTAVLDVCERYLRFRGDTDDGVDANFLRTRIKALEDGRYILTVVGEAEVFECLQQIRAIQDRYRNIPTTTFETFPFPDGLAPDIRATDYTDDPRAVVIAEAARQLVDLRNRCSIRRNGWIGWTSQFSVIRGAWSRVTKGW